MRVLLVAAVIAVIAIGGRAVADDVDEHVAEGEALAKQGQWSLAIDAFKAADAKRPRAKHACLIGLAYTRRELWPEAELFFSLCHQRAVPSDPLPEWVAEAEHELADKLAASSASAVAIEVTPATAAAQVSVSSFAPGETFSPRTIHLAPGTHVITVTAPDYEPAKREIAVAGGRPQTVAFSLALSHPPASRVPLYFYATGAALAIVGVAFDELGVQPQRNALSGATTHAVYEATKSTFETRQTAAIAVFAMAGALAATGAVLRYTVFRHHEAIHATAAIAPGTAMVGVEWSR